MLKERRLLNKVKIKVIKGNDYASLKKKKDQWIDRQRLSCESVFFSNAYCQDEVFISKFAYRHGLDVEDRSLSLKHQKKFLMPEDRNVLEILGTEDARIIWVLKEALIKETSGVLHDLISGKMRIDYRKAEANYVLLSYQSKDYHFFFRTFADKVLGIVSQEEIEKIEIID